LISLFDSISLFNPFKFNPKNWSKIREFKQTLKDFRNFAKEQILQRMDEIKNGDEVRNDILSFIMKSQGSTLILNLEIIIKNTIIFF
jgi:hypothetical protein